MSQICRKVGISGTLTPACVSALCACEGVYSSLLARLRIFEMVVMCVYLCVSVWVSLDRTSVATIQNYDIYTPIVKFHVKKSFCVYEKIY